MANRDGVPSREALEALLLPSRHVNQISILRFIAEHSALDNWDKQALRIIAAQLFEDTELRRAIADGRLKVVEGDQRS